MSVIVPNDIEQLQKYLASYVAQLDACASHCDALTNDPAFVSEWVAMKFAVSAYVNTPVSVFTNTTGTFYDQGTALKGQLDGYQAKIQAACPNCAPPKAPDPQGSQNQASNLIGALTTLLVVGGGLYLLTRVVK